MGLLVVWLCLISLAGCGGEQAWEQPPRQALPARVASPIAAPYPVSPRGGTPKTGPGDRYNRCERIWCLTHEENFHIDHFLKGHVGWIFHDTLAGDIFAARGRVSGPEFPHAKMTALRLCGAHVHPHLLGRGGGPIRDGFYTYGLGFSRAHFNAYGTRLDPCCINGLGSDYVHTRDGGRISRHDLSEYRANPDRGWQKPFQAVPTPAR